MKLSSSQKEAVRFAAACEAMGGTMGIANNEPNIRSVRACVEKGALTPGWRTTEAGRKAAGVQP